MVDRGDAEDPDLSTDALAARIAELETRVIAQEHRPLSIIDDLRRQPRYSDNWWRAVMAMFSRMFLASPVVATGATAIAVVGALLAWDANRKLQAQNEKLDTQNGLVELQNQLVQTQATLAAEQNVLVQKQNEFFQQQIQQQAVQTFRARRAELIATLFDRRECLPREELPSEAPEIDGKPSVGCPAASIQARAEALVTLVQIERQVRAQPEDWPGVRVEPFTVVLDVDLSGADFAGADLRGLILLRADLRGTNFSRADLREVVLEGAADETSFYGADVRGGTLLFTADGGGSAEFSNAILSGSFVGGFFSRVSFDDASLWGAVLSLHASERVTLRQADVRGTTWLTGYPREDGFGSLAADVVASSGCRVCMADLENQGCVENPGWCEGEEELVDPTNAFHSQAQRDVTRSRFLDR